MASGIQVEPDQAKGSPKATRNQVAPGPTSRTSVVTPLRRRRQPRLIIAGLLAVILAGLGAGVLFTTVTKNQSVVVVNRPVARGEVIGTTDLGTTQVGALPGVSTVPSAEVSTLIGQRALVDLAPGSLLAAGSIGDLPGVSGKATVGLKLAPGRIPNSPLPAGTALTLVVVADSQNPSAGGTGENPRGVAAESLGLAVPAGDGVSWLLDVLVAEDQAAAVARLAGGDAIAVIKDGL